MTYWTYSPRWTEEERDKAAYVAARAMRLGRDPAADVAAYMGMTERDVCLAVERAGKQLRGEGRRRQAGDRRSAMGWTQ